MNRVKLRKGDIISCLRAVTKDKILGIKEARNLFEARIKKLIRAQNYELRSQEAFALIAAQHVFAAQAKRVCKIFDSEGKELLSDYRGIYDLARYYERKLKQQSTKLALQECIISKLSNHISTTLKTQVRARIEAKESLEVYPFLAPSPSESSS